MAALFDIILPVFLVIAFGYIAAYKGVFTQSGVQGLMKFAQNFAIPCLLFRAISTLDLQAGFDPRLLLSFYAGATSCFILGMLGARYIFKRPPMDCVAIGFCCLFSNSVLLGLPITERAFGPAALTGNYAILSIHAPFCYGLGITVMEIVRAQGKPAGTLVKTILKSMFSNALIIGIAAGFVVNLSGLPVPGPVTSAIDLMARAAIPAALFGLGGVLMQYRPEGDMRAILFVVALSLIVHPIIVWTIGSSVNLDRDAFRSAIMTASMAPGINAYVFANMYGAARRVAASSVLIATGSSIITIWLWLLILP